MSNVIKAYNIRYEEKAKKIDCNDRAEQLIKEYIEKNGKLPLGAEDNRDFNLSDIPDNDTNIAEGNSDGGFIEGIPAVRYDGDLENVLGEKENKTEDNISEESYAEESPIEPEKVMKEADLQLMNDEYLKHQEEVKRKIEEESAKILEDAKTEVKRLMTQAVRDAEEAKEEIFEKARIEGYDTGFNEGVSKIEQLKQELEDKEKARIAEYEKQVQDIEPAFVDIVISLVQKLTGIEAEDNKEIIFYLIHQAIFNQTASNSYIIRVSKNDYDYVMAKKDSLQAFIKKGAVVEILEDHLLTKNQCLIETDSRIIDCSLDVQLKNLIKDLKLLSN